MKNSQETDSTQAFVTWLRVRWTGAWRTLQAVQPHHLLCTSRTSHDYARWLHVWQGVAVLTVLCQPDLVAEEEYARYAERGGGGGATREGDAIDSVRSGDNTRSGSNPRSGDNSRGRRPATTTTPTPTPRPGPLAHLEWNRRMVANIGRMRSPPGLKVILWGAEPLGGGGGGRVNPPPKQPTKGASTSSSGRLRPAAAGRLEELEEEILHARTSHVRWQQWLSKSPRPEVSADLTSSFQELDGDWACVQWRQIPGELSLLTEWATPGNWDLGLVVRAMLDHYAQTDTVIDLQPSPARAWRLGCIAGLGLSCLHGAGGRGPDRKGRLYLVAAPEEGDPLLDLAELWRLASEDGWAAKLWYSPVAWLAMLGALASVPHQCPWDPLVSEDILTDGGSDLAASTASVSEESVTTEECSPWWRTGSRPTALPALGSVGAQTSVGVAARQTHTPGPFGDFAMEDISMEEIPMGDFGANPAPTPSITAPGVFAPTPLRDRAQTEPQDGHFSPTVYLPTLSPTLQGHGRPIPSIWEWVSSFPSLRVMHEKVAVCSPHLQDAVFRCVQQFMGQPVPPVVDTLRYALVAGVAALPIERVMDHAPQEGTPAELWDWVAGEVLELWGRNLLYVGITTKSELLGWVRVEAHRMAWTLGRGPKGGSQPHDTDGQGRSLWGWGRGGVLAPTPSYYHSASVSTVFKHHLWAAGCLDC